MVLKLKKTGVTASRTAYITFLHTNKAIIITDASSGRSYQLELERFATDMILQHNVTPKMKIRVRLGYILRVHEGCENRSETIAVTTQYVLFSPQNKHLPCFKG